MNEWAPAQRLVLASASQHRRRLLMAAGLVFDVSPAAVDEAASKRTLVSGVPMHRQSPAVWRLKSTSGERQVAGSPGDRRRSGAGL